MRNEDKMNQNTTADMLFLCDAMGAEYPFRDLERLPMWFGAARANPEKRAAGLATLRAYQRQIPTEADFARVPSEVPKRDTVLIDPESLIVRDSNGDALGRWHGAKYIGQCPCESGETFAACHGAEDVPIEPASPALEAQWRRLTMPAPCEHDKVYSDHILTSNPPKYPWICRKCKARGRDVGASTGPRGEYEKILRGAGAD